MFGKRITNRDRRLHTPGSSGFGLKNKNTGASVRLDRIQRSIKKNLKDGKPGEIVGSMQSEVGWFGLCLLGSCLIVIVWIVLYIVSSGDHSELNGMQHANSNIEGNVHHQYRDLNDIDPEEWPHRDGNRQRNIDNNNNNNMNNNNNNNNNINNNNQNNRINDNLNDDRLSANGGRPPIPQDIRDRRRPRDPAGADQTGGRRGRPRGAAGAAGGAGAVPGDDMEGMPDGDMRPFGDYRDQWREERDRRRAERAGREGREGRGGAGIPRGPEGVRRDYEDFGDFGDFGDLDDPEFERARRRERDRVVEDVLGRDVDARRRENSERARKGRQIQVPVKPEGQIGLRPEDMTNFNGFYPQIAALDLDALKALHGPQGPQPSAEDVTKYDLDVTVEEKAYRIKHAFLHAWHGYAKHALGHDEIQPVSDLPGDSWGGLGATLIDALDTLMLMGIKEEFIEARKKLDDIHFDIDLQVSFFETTIRHLGGLIGAHEVSQLIGPKDEVYLPHAVQLADHLLAAFNTKTGIPKSMVNLKTGEIKNYGWTKDKSVLSEVGSNQLELYAMSHFTGNLKYYSKTKHVLRTLDDMEKEDLLYARLIDADTASFPRNEKVYTVGGMADSFYEYLLKLWILSKYQDTESLRMYIDTIDAMNEMLLRQVYDENRRQEPYYFYGEQWYNKFRGKTEELTCFMPGVLALGSYHAELRQKEHEASGVQLTQAELELIARKETHLKLAHALVESCVQLYFEMPTGLAPESIQFDENGWQVKEPRYQLRPETLESLYILFSITENELYRKWAWKIFKSLEMHCKTEVAFSGVTDVRDVPVTQDNKMESYVMAETFKYLYLLFDDYAGSLLPLNKFVFNTEAHPIRIFELNLEDWLKNVDPNEQKFVRGFDDENINRAGRPEGGNAAGIGVEGQQRQEA